MGNDFVDDLRGVKRPLHIAEIVFYPQDNHAVPDVVLLPEC